MRRGVSHAQRTLHCDSVDVCSRWCIAALTRPRGRLTAAEGNAHLVSAKLRQGASKRGPRPVTHTLACHTAALTQPACPLPDWGNVVVANWKLWVPFQFLNFRFVPPALQVAAANGCAVVWNVILSLLSHAKVQAPAPPPAVVPAKGKAVSKKK